MRTNALKAKLSAGRRVCGVQANFHNPELLEVFGHLGFDFVFLDGQHSGLTVETARELIRAADLTGMSTFVRVPRNDPSIILEYLDVGVGGIMIPNVVTRADVDAAVSAMRYPPEGTRSGFGRGRAANYGITQSQAEWFREANNHVFFIPLIEHKDAIPHLEAICSAPGVDAINIGPSDLALSMGIPGGWSDPAVQEVVEQIRATAAACGKPTILLALDEADGRRLFDNGYQGVFLSQITLISDAARGFLQSMSMALV
jgi:2-keto-3-deoxy-L-rhamnonate aldolase RhmA